MCLSMRAGTMKKGGPRKDRLFSGRPEPFGLHALKRLTLRELEALTCLGLTIFLTFYGTAVAGQEAFGLDRAA